MPGYKHPCRYCGELVPPDSEVCPFCAKANPSGAFRCPKCRAPVEERWKSCSSCGLKLEIPCPKCGETVFFGDYCSKCGARLTVVCSDKRCAEEQPPVSAGCRKCGKPLAVKLTGGK
jgi:RNA polymerase subunit RPABC4/transcription elongation factor Spt4